MASDLARITVTIPEDLLAQLDELTARRGLAPNRSEAIRDLIREQVVEESVGDADAEVVGSVTMVYDHHIPGLTQRLDEIQHEHLDAVISKMHVHLDHGLCLETIAVRGPSGKVHSLADQLLGVKGVEHGKLVCVAAAGSDGHRDHHHHHR
ncbi:MAG: nickel-responsive transcriptional regulator NikR [Coriobacteriaceae bacterium]|nr:nickel-responsive transcriptional regulator NikR [Coriobacteriaceae bacterium]